MIKNYLNSLIFISPLLDRMKNLLDGFATSVKTIPVTTFYVFDISMFRTNSQLFIMFVVLY